MPKIQNINFFKIIKQIILATIFLVISVTVYAGPGCCSHHGGVDGCDETTGRIRCNDGTLSPSCTCSKTYGTTDDQGNSGGGILIFVIILAVVITFFAYKNKNSVKSLEVPPTYSPNNTLENSNNLSNNKVQEKKNDNSISYLHKKTDTEICPKCGFPMVLRKARKGYSRGRKFWGCSKYPECKGTKSILTKSQLKKIERFNQYFGLKK